MDRRALLYRGGQDVITPVHQHTAGGPPPVPNAAGRGATPAAPDAGAHAFERLTLPHLGDVARFARALTRDAARADDLVQETYLQALRGWHTFRDGANPRRWLFAVCHHAFLRTARRDARYVEAPEADPGLESLATTVAYAHARQGGVAERAECLDLGPAIARALDTLSVTYRGAVVLVDVEGQTYEAAALVLGVAVGTVRSRLFRGRRLLQRRLVAYGRDAGFTSTRTAG